MTTPILIASSCVSSAVTVKSSITGLASSVSAIRRTSASRSSVGLAVDLELEPLALADVGDAVEAEPRQRAEHGLALGVEDLALGHHVDDDRATAVPFGRRRSSADEASV